MAAADGNFAGDGWNLRIAGERFELERDSESYSGEVELVDKMIALQGSSYEHRYEATSEIWSSHPGAWAFVLKPDGDGIHFELYSGSYFRGLGSIPPRISGERVALLTRK